MSPFLKRTCSPWRGFLVSGTGGWQGCPQQLGWTFGGWLRDFDVPTLEDVSEALMSPTWRMSQRSDVPTLEHVSEALMSPRWSMSQRSDVPTLEDVSEALMSPCWRMSQRSDVPTLEDVSEIWCLHPGGCLRGSGFLSLFHLISWQRSFSTLLPQRLKFLFQFWPWSAPSNSLLYFSIT